MLHAARLIISCRLKHTIFFCNFCDLCHFFCVPMYQCITMYVPMYVLVTMYVPKYVPMCE